MTRRTSKIRLALCILLPITLLWSACTDDGEDAPPEEPDRPSPTETIRTDDLHAQIDEVEDACDLLNAEMIKEYLLGDDYEEPTQPGSPTSVCNTGVWHDPPDSRADINLNIWPEDSNIEAVEHFYGRVENPDSMVEGYVAESGGTEAYAVVYSPPGETGSYIIRTFILGEFYVIRAELIVTEDDLMPTDEEAGMWVYEEYAPTVVESIESRLSR